MKKWILLIALLALCTACTSKTQTPTQSPETTAPTTAPEVSAHELDPQIVGTWVKSGEFAENADYVETLLISDDGTISVQLDFRGEPYQTLTGTWYTDGRHFVVYIAADEPYTTDYQYIVDGRELTLQSEDGTYVYYSE